MYLVFWLAKQLFFNHFSLWKLYELWLSWLFLVRLQDRRMWPFQFFIWRKFDFAIQSLKFNLVESSPRSGLGSEQHSYKVLKPLSYHFQNFITLDTCRFSVSMLCQLASDKIINDEKTLLNLSTMLLENEDRRMQVYTSFNFLGWVLLRLHHVHKIINSMNALDYMLYWFIWLFQPQLS